MPFNEEHYLDEYYTGNRDDDSDSSINGALPGEGVPSLSPSREENFYEIANDVKGGKNDNEGDDDDEDEEEEAAAKTSEDDNGSETDMEAKIEKELNKKQLIRLEKMFLEADADGGGTLDIEEFVAAMKTIMPQLTERELELLFMKIDANCDENVDWDEYLGYMLLEFQEKDIMQSMSVLKPFPRPSLEGHPSHKVNVIKLLLIPSMRHANKQEAVANQLDYLNGSLLSISKDGIVNFWSPTLEHRRSEPMDLSLDKDTPTRKAMNSKVWILDACSMLNVNAIAATTTNRDIHIYDTTGTSFWRRYHIVGFETCLGCIDYWFNKDNMNQAIMIMGDNNGNVTAVVWHEALHGSGLFTKTSKYKKQTEVQVIRLEEMIKGKCVTLNAVLYKNLHRDWVTSVKYFEKARNNFFLSCCSDFETAMFFGHINLEEPSPEPHGHYFKHSRGINCFEFRSNGNVIITGQSDGLVKLWDPFIPNHSIGVMKGHTVSVIQLQMDSFRDQLISVSKDNVIIVWNMKDGLSLQTLTPRVLFDKNTHRSIGAVCFNPQLLSLGIATNVVILLEQLDPKEQAGKPVSHTCEVTSALYNDIFEVIVSTDINSTISVFDIATGQKVIQFINAHTTSMHGLKPVEITATCFVEKKTRLITGASNGTLKIWNYNNGQILRTMETVGNTEVTCIVFAKQCIFAAGWNKRVTVFVDGVDNEAVDPLTKVWPQKHKEDILSMSANEALHILVTGAYDGEMIVWNLDTGYLIFRLDATTSRYPITVWSMMALKEMGQIDSGGKRMLDDPGNSQKSGKTKPSLKVTKTRSHQSISAGQDTKSKPSLTPSKLQTSPGSFDNGRRKGSRQSEMSGPDSNIPADTTKGIILPPIAKTSTHSQGFEEPDYPQSVFGKLMRRTIEDAKDKINPYGVCIGAEQIIEVPTETINNYDVDVESDKYRNAIEKIIFLKTREQKRLTATLIAADSGGWIRAWSTHPQGGLVGQFHAAFNESSGIMCIDVDEKETMLFIGDSTGHLHIWDISGWCEEGKQVLCTMEDEDEVLEAHPYFQRFPYLLSIAKLRYKTYSSFADSLPSHLDAETLKIPLRLNCWLAHVKSTVAVQFIDEKELVASASSSGTVRLWTILGSYIGAFGQEKSLPWDIPELIKAPSEEKVESVVDQVDSWGSLITLTDSQIEAAAAKEKNRINVTRRQISDKRHVKSDLLRLASALSLRVYNQGSCPYWKYAKNIILIWCVRFAGNKVDDSHKLMEIERETEEWPGVPPTSDILGKTYHPIQRYKEPLDYKKLVRIEAGQLAVYHCVPLIPSMAEDEVLPEIPQCVKDHHAEQKREKMILCEGNVRPNLKNQKGRSKRESVKLPKIN